MAWFRDVQAAGVQARLALMLGHNQVSTVSGGMGGVVPLLTVNYALLSTATGPAFRLPPATGQASNVFFNIGPDAAQLYPDPLESINALDPGQPFQVDPGAPVMLVPSNTHWLALGSGGGGGGGSGGGGGFLSATGVYISGTPGNLVVNRSACAPPPLPTNWDGAAIRVLGGNGLNDANILADAYGQGSNYSFRRANNTCAAPLPLADGDIVGVISARGYAPGGYAVNAGARIVFAANGDWTGANQAMLVGVEQIRLATTTGPAVRVAEFSDGVLALGKSLPAVRPALPSVWAGALLRLFSSDGANDSNVLIDSVGSAGHYSFRRANGALATPAPLVDGDVLGSIQARGFAPGGYPPVNPSADIRFVADGAWSSASQAVWIDFQQVLPGTAATALVSAMSLKNGGLVIGAAGGGSMGPGTLNVAGNVYLNGTPLSAGGGSGGIPEAPLGVGAYWVRSNAIWAAGVNEAPADGLAYARRNSGPPAGNWVRAVAANGDTMTGMLVISRNTPGATLPPLPSTWPGTTLRLVGSDGQNDPNVLIDGIGNFGNVAFRRANGTLAAPTPLIDGDVIGTMTARGYGSSGYGGMAAARLEFHADGAWTGASNGVYFEFQQTLPGTLTPAVVGQLRGGVMILGQNLAALPPIPSTWAGARLRLIGSDGRNDPNTLIDGFGAAGQFSFRTAGGTQAAPAPLADNDTAGVIAGRGYAPGGYPDVAGARIVFRADGAWTGLSQAMHIDFEQVLPGTTGGTFVALSIKNGGLVVDNAAGGSLGPGTVNATGLFINGVAVGTGGGGGGITDAPADGTRYVRRNAAWVAPDDDSQLGIAAGGLTQATATQLASQFNVITNGSGPGAAVALPSGRPGRRCGVKNAWTNPIQVFPRLGDAARVNSEPIDGVGALIQPDGMMWFEGESATQWHA